MARGLSDPSWKSGPTYPEPTASEHAIDPEPAGYDHDGVGRDEAERVDGTALCAVREAYSCSRDGCDVSPRRIHVYALSDVSDRLMKIARHAINAASKRRDGAGQSGDSPDADYTDNADESATSSGSREANASQDPEEGDFVEFFAVRAQVVDYDEGPILGFEVGDDVVGYVYPHFTDEHGFGGSCYGRVEPDPEPQWRDI